MDWENIYIFISSTFSDMNAERDFLIKNVFPELSLWCEKYRLRLVDIDLRWGVTEEDATKNNRVVDLCMQGIDRCQPFFICFLGQRRGWVPTKNELSDETLVKWPDLEDWVGKKSITELEILHSLSQQKSEIENSKVSAKTNHCLFLLRNASYLKDISSEKTREIYMSSSQEEKNELEQFKDRLRSSYSENAVDYHATWDPNKFTPELYKNELSEQENADIQRGRLTDFRVKDVSMKHYLLNYLKKGIMNEYPEHFTDNMHNFLSEEASLQNKFLVKSLDGYVDTNETKTRLSDFFRDKSKQIFLLFSEEGAGKSSFAANIINSRLNSEKVIYRFIDASDKFASIYDVLRSILVEMSQQKYFSCDMIPAEDALIKKFFLSTINKIEDEQQHLIVIDGFDRLSGYNGLEWLCNNVSSNFKFVFTVSESSKINTIALEDSVVVYNLKSLNADNQKKLIDVFLSKYLKKLDATHLSELMKLEGTDNPLFLRIVLSELRVFGSFELLLKKIKTNFGRTPTEAFEGLLERIESDSSVGVDNSTVVPLLFSLISCSKNGLTADELSEMICSFGLTEYQIEEVREKVNEIYYQVRDFCLLKNGRISFRHASLESAVRYRYGAMFNDCRKFIFEYATKKTHIYENSEDKCLSVWYEEILYQLNELQEYGKLIDILGNFQKIYSVTVNCGPELYLKTITGLPSNIVPKHIKLFKNVVVNNFNLLKEERKAIISLLVNCLYNEDDSYISNQVLEYFEDNESLLFIPGEENNSCDKNEDCLFSFDNISCYMYVVEWVFKRDNSWIFLDAFGNFFLVDSQNRFEYDYFTLNGVPEGETIESAKVYENRLAIKLSDGTVCFYNFKNCKLEKTLKGASDEFDFFEKDLFSNDENRGTVRLPLGEEIYIELQKNEKNKVEAFVCDLNGKRNLKLEYMEDFFLDNAVFWNEYIIARTSLLLEERFYVFEAESGRLIRKFTVEGKCFLEDDIVIVNSFQNNYIKAYSYQQFISAGSGAIIGQAQKVDDFEVTPSLLLIKKTAKFDDMMRLMVEMLQASEKTSFIKEFVKGFNPLYSIKKIKEVVSLVKSATTFEKITVSKRTDETDLVFVEKTFGIDVKTASLTNGIVLYFQKRRQANKLLFLNDDGTVKQKRLFCDIAKFYTGEDSLYATTKHNKIFKLSYGRVGHKIKYPYEIDSATGSGENVFIYSNQGKLLQYNAKGELLSEDEVEKDLSPKMVVFGSQVFLATQDGRLIMHIIGEADDYEIKAVESIRYMCKFRHYLVYVANDIVYFFDTIFMRIYTEVATGLHVEKIAFIDDEMYVLTVNGHMQTYTFGFLATNTNGESYRTPQNQEDFFEQVEFLERYFQFGDDIVLYNRVYSGLLDYIENCQYFESEMKMILALDTVLSVSAFTDDSRSVSGLVLKISELSYDFIQKTKNIKRIKEILELNKLIFAKAYALLYKTDLSSETDFCDFFSQLKINIIKMMECELLKEGLFISELRMYDIAYEYTWLIRSVNEEARKKVYKNKAVSLIEHIYEFTQDEDYKKIIEEIKAM